MSMYFRASKLLQYPIENVSLFPREQQTDSFTHDDMIREEKPVGKEERDG